MSGGRAAAGARDELAAARVLAVSGLTTQAVEVAVGAALRVAEAALLLVDRIPPAAHGALVADFVAHVVRKRGVDAEAGRAVRLLLNRRHLAEITPPPAAEAQIAIDDAHAVVETVGAWIDASWRVALQRRRPAPPVR